jgi:hypothetical protein
MSAPNGREMDDKREAIDALARQVHEYKRVREAIWDPAQQADENIWHYTSLKLSGR